jgi:hypothetical protein
MNVPLLLQPAPKTTRPPADQVFIRYLRLYVLHQVEQTAIYAHQGVLRTRVATVRYVFTRLPEELDARWQSDARAGAELAREVLVPRLDMLMDEDTAWEKLGLTGKDRQTWRPYLEARRRTPGGLLRALPSVQSLTPWRSTSPVRIEEQTGSRFVQRLDQAQRLLEFTHNALQVADTALKLWQNWKSGQQQRQLLEARRLLLQDSLKATLLGQQSALNNSLEPGFVTRYLAAHGDDSAYDVLFGDVEED